MWSGLGINDFYQQLAVNVLSNKKIVILDICAKTRYQNGGIMKIDDIIYQFNLTKKQTITKYFIKFLSPKPR
jgi:hypothetical protein